MPSNNPPQATLLAALLIGIVTVLLAALALAQPWSTRIRMGEHDHFYLQGFHTREYSSYDTLTFRWSEPEARVVFKGAGVVTPLELHLHGGEHGTAVELDTGTGSSTRVQLRPGWQHVLLLPRPHTWNGNVAVDIAAPARSTPQDGRQRGVVFHWIGLQGHAGTFPPGQAALIGLSSALMVLLVSWCSARSLPLRWSLLAGVLAGTAVTVAAVWALLHHGGASRLLITHYNARLVLVLGVGALLAFATDALLTRCKPHNTPVKSSLPAPVHAAASRHTLRAALCFLPRWLGGMRPSTRRLLVAVALLAFLLRFGSMAYPLTTTTDVKFHVGRAWMVRSGKFLVLFLPNPKLTPIQWDSEITIPRSPFYYLLTVPATYMPGDGAILASKAFGSAVEAAAVLLVAAMTWYATHSNKSVLLAALLVALMPFGLRIAVSWGIFPTLLAQLLSFLAALLWLHLRPRLHEWRAQMLLTAALTLAFIAYPTGALFMGTTCTVLLLLLALRRDPALLPTLRAAVVAVAAVTLLYYGWHLPVLVSQTIPVMLDAFAGSGTLNSTQTPAPIGLALLWEPLRGHYGIHILVLAVGGALLLAARCISAGYTGILLLAWCATYLPFAVASASVPLLEKHTAYLLPVLAVLGGVFLGKIVQHRTGGVVGLALLALVGWQALVMLYDIIVHNLR